MTDLNNAPAPSPASAPRHPRKTVLKTGHKPSQGGAETQEPIDATADQVAWTWAAAAAVEERRLLTPRRPGAVERLPWGSSTSDGLAEALVLRALDPASFARWLGEGGSPPRRGGPEVPRPAGIPATWDELADHLWQQLGVEVHPEVMPAKGDFLLVTPYHVVVPVDEKHPHFSIRSRRPLPAGFVGSLRIIGCNTRPMIVCPHDDLDGVCRLYVKAGNKRTLGARAANKENEHDYRNTIKS